MLRPDHVDVLHILNGCKDPKHRYQLPDSLRPCVPWIMVWRWKAAVSRATDFPVPPRAHEAMN